MSTLLLGGYNVEALRDVTDAEALLECGVKFYAEALPYIQQALERTIAIDPWRSLLFGTRSAAVVAEVDCRLLCHYFARTI